MLNAVPVCAGCGGSAGMSASCTRCLKICCTACFNWSDDITLNEHKLTLLADRLCRKCHFDRENSSGSGVVVMKKSAVASGAAGCGTDDRQARCMLHQWMCRLFCVSCSEVICGRCVEPGQRHERHRIDNLVVVYGDNVDGVRQKLASAKKLNNVLHSHTAAYKRNLQRLENEESDLMQEIEALAETSKSALLRMTNPRKGFLEGKLKVPAVHDNILDDLQGKVDHLSENEFVEQFAAIDAKCDELNEVPKPVALQKVDDFKCDLISEYQFKTMLLRLLTTETGGNQTCSMKAAHGIEWKLTVTKADMLKVSANPSDPDILKFRHKVIVIIPHSDYSLSIHQAFELEGATNEFDVVETSYLVDHGFCTELGNLVIRIGIRPQNVVIHNRLLNHRYEQQKEKAEKAEKQLLETTEKYNYNLIMNFKTNLGTLQGSLVNIYSPEIEDDQDRKWQLELQLSLGWIGAYVTLKAGSAATRCKYFIELKHRNSEKTIVSTATSGLFEIGKGWGWSRFVALGTLNNDNGFHPDGYLRFRVGVRSLPGDRKTTFTFGAAKA